MGNFVSLAACLLRSRTSLTPASLSWPSSGWSLILILDQLLGTTHTLLLASGKVFIGSFALLEV